MEVKRLDNLKINQNGRIRRIVTDDERLMRKLTDMGLTPGTEVRLVKFAPMGDPMELHLRGYSLSLRKADAAAIELMDERESLHSVASSIAARNQYEEKGRQIMRTVRHSDREDDEVHERAGRITNSILKASCCAKNTCSDCRKSCIKAIFKPVELENGKKTEKNALQNKPESARLALVGNPNCGKTTLFNAMTGEREYVGNWAGVTVEKKEGRVKSIKADENGLDTEGHDIILVDLPGIYSLSPFGMEERIARQYILTEKPDAIINIIDATNLERNLYLTVQLLELERPMVIALNMMDEVRKRGDSIDCAALSKELGIPVIPISARTGMGIDDLISQSRIILNTAHAQSHEGFKLEPDHLYDDYTHAMHHRVGELVEKYAQEAGLPVHWVSIKLLEGDEPAAAALKLPENVRKAVHAISDEYAAASGSSFANSASMLADNRYRYITEVVGKVLKRGRSSDEPTLSDRIDRVLTNKFLAMPIFILLMAAVFTLTFGTLGAWLKGLMENLIFDITIPAVGSALTDISVSEWLVSLICDGILAGVGGVVTFLPEIAILFLCLSLLEDSGYMSRIAFIMDRPMRNLGLSGKSFIPMLMGFGCTVPATMAARTMENMRDKRSTILLLPFMSCSAKLPVYALIAGAFFSKGSTLVVLSLYLLGILLAMVFGIIFKNIIFKSNEAVFMLELPDYRLPKLKDTMLHVWERVKHFLVKAGTLIFVMSIVVWVLMNFSFTLAPVGEHVENSILGRIGGAAAFLFKPLGFGSWMAVVALLTGFVAKESIVSTMSVLVGSTLTAGTAAAALGTLFTPISAYSFLVFVSLYTPCVAAVATMRRELGSRKYTLFAVAFQIAIAYLAAFFVYTFGSVIFG
ncbi:MAG: ferrous iron transport protein B [Christensenellaceae bacterium]|nr:ferrous iron transport protein B [Christensenellaceae bacterium]